MSKVKASKVKTEDLDASSVSTIDLAVLSPTASIRSESMDLVSERSYDDDVGRAIDSSHLLKIRTEKAEPGPITFALLLKKGVKVTKGKTYTADEKAEMLLSTTHLHLDRANINEIDNLESMSQVTHLYLQHNLIEQIDNIEFLNRLKFLALSNNKIKSVNNIKHLQTLIYVDLSDNEISDFDEAEFPRSISFLMLSGNPCCLDLAYRSRLIKALPKLKELDDVEVVDLEKLALGLELTGPMEDIQEEIAEEVVNAQVQTKEKPAPIDEPTTQTRIAIDVQKPVQSWYEMATNMDQIEQQIQQRRQERRHRAELRNLEWEQERQSTRKRIDEAKRHFKLAK